MKRNQDNIKLNDGKVTIAIDNRKGTTTHKNEVRFTDNIKHNDGKVTPVIDDRKGTTTHKNEVRFTDNIKHNDDKVTSVNDDREGTATHKTRVRKETIANNTGKLRKACISKFHAPMRKPNKAEERTMIGKAMEVLIISCMKNHIYKFSNKVRIQSEGGPIGLGLTGEVADCYMIKWNKNFM